MGVGEADAHIKKFDIGYKWYCFQISLGGIVGFFLVSSKVIMLQSFCSLGAYLHGRW